jgi:hypothetical protein
MPITQSQKAEIARIKIHVETVRKKQEKLKERKRQLTESFKRRIEQTSDSIRKRSIRIEKIAAMDRISKESQSLKDEISRYRKRIAVIKK